MPADLISARAVVLALGKRRAHYLQRNKVSLAKGWGIEAGITATQVAELDRAIQIVEALAAHARKRKTKR